MDYQMHGMHTGQKKLVIKGFRGPRALPKNYEQESWSKLEEAVKAIQSRSTFVRYSLEKLNQIVSNLVDGNTDLAQRIHSQLKRVCEEHINNKLNQLDKCGSSDTVHFLEMLDQIWRDHCKAFTLIINLFLKLDRSSTSGGLWETGLEIFGRLVCQKKIEQKTISGLLSLIMKDRSGDMVDCGLIRSLVGMLSAINMYSKFESDLLAESNKYFLNQSKSKLDELDIRVYLELAEKTLNDEEKRATAYLEPSTLRPLVKLCQTNFIGSNMILIASRGLSDMMINSRHDDLKRLYKLFSNEGIDGFNALKNELTQWVKHQGSAIVVNPEKDSTMVNELLEFKHKIDEITKKCFENNRVLGDAVHDAFKYFINIRKNRPAELIAKHVDQMMRAGNKVIDDTQLEKKLDEVMSIFRFIHGKDVFEKFYKNDLAKRLLHNRSASDDAEKAMLSKLKEECGAGFTSKLEGMFKDMEVSKELLKAYKKKSSSADKKKEIELNVSILTTGNWTMPQITLDLPANFMRLAENFKTYYSSKHTSRKLTFNHFHSSAILIANYKHENGKPRSHELQVALSQCCILLLFNDKDEIGYLEIKSSTNLADKELKRQLQSLSLGKQKLLLKSTKGKDVGEGVTFKWNEKFKCNLFRIKINQVQVKETVEENKETNEQIFQDRQLQVDAAIVRIMKAKKELSHSELMASLFEHLHFPINPPDLKKRIEHLIDRDFIERDPDSSTRYRYLA